MPTAPAHCPSQGPQQSTGTAWAAEPSGSVHDKGQHGQHGQEGKAWSGGKSAGTQGSVVMGVQGVGSMGQHGTTWVGGG